MYAAGTVSVMVRQSAILCCCMALSIMAGVCIEVSPHCVKVEHLHIYVARAMHVSATDLCWWC